MIKISYGHINLNKNINITDPSYDEDVWCRINNFPIPAGEYECYVRVLNNKETEGFGDRIAVCGIRKEKPDQYQRIGMIGVDSGMAGFFNCDNKKVFENMIQHGYTDDVFAGDDYFYTSSGYGDGGYDVYAGYKDGNITEVYIEFIRV